MSDDADSLVSLNVEHTRLFAGLTKTYGAASPYEAVSRENALPSDSSIAVAAAYAEAGPLGACIGGVQSEHRHIGHPVTNPKAAHAIAELIDFPNDIISQHER
jgi:hypothetical protein